MSSSPEIDHTSLFFHCSHFKDGTHLQYSRPTSSSILCSSSSLYRGLAFSNPHSGPPSSVFLPRKVSISRKLHQLRAKTHKMVKSADKLIGKKIIVVGGTSGLVPTFHCFSPAFIILTLLQNWIRSSTGIHRCRRSGDCDFIQPRQCQ
jgi:hypothetical protein